VVSRPSSHSGRAELEVGEEDEISIKDVADAIVQAIGFEGEYQVSHLVLIQHHRADAISVRFE
jgi:hypothetical protein